MLCLNYVLYHIAMRCIGSVKMRCVHGFDFVVSVSVLSVHSVVMEWMEVLCSALSASVSGFRMRWLYPIASYQ